MLRTMAALLLSGQPAARTVWAEGRMGLDLCLSGKCQSPMRFPTSLQALWLLLLPAFPSLPLQVHHILQEVVIGGMVLETNMNEIVAQVEAQSKLEKAEVSGNAVALLCGRLMDSRLRGGQPVASGAGAYGVSSVSTVSACLSPHGEGWGIPPSCAP